MGRLRPCAGSAALPAEEARATLVRLYPVYDAFIQLAKGEPPRLGEMLARLGAPRGAAEPPTDGAARVNGQETARRRGAPVPVSERAGARVDDGPADTYAMELRGADGAAFKIGWALRHENRARGFNQVSMPELGGIRYVPVLSQPWPSAVEARAMEQELLRRFGARIHPANQEVVTGVPREELEAAWAEVVEATQRRAWSV